MDYLLQGLNVVDARLPAPGLVQYRIANCNCII